MQKSQYTLACNSIWYDASTLHKTQTHSCSHLLPEQIQQASVLLFRDDILADHVLRLERPWRPLPHILLLRFLVFLLFRLHQFWLGWLQPCRRILSLHVFLRQLNLRLVPFWWPLDLCTCRRRFSNDTSDRSSQEPRTSAAHITEAAACGSSITARITLLPVTAESSPVSGPSEHP